LTIDGEMKEVELENEEKPNGVELPEETVPISSETPITEKETPLTNSTSDLLDTGYEIRSRVTRKRVTTKDIDHEMDYNDENETDEEVEQKKRKKRRITRKNEEDEDFAVDEDEEDYDDEISSAATSSSSSPEPSPRYHTRRLKRIRNVPEITQEEGIQLRPRTPTTKFLINQIPSPKKSKPKNLDRRPKIKLDDGSSVNFSLF
jgi:hypothetical protein